MDLNAGGRRCRTSEVWARCIGLVTPKSARIHWDSLTSSWHCLFDVSTTTNASLRGVDMEMARMVVAPNNERPVAVWGFSGAPAKLKGQEEPKRLFRARHVFRCTVSATHGARPGPECSSVNFRTKTAPVPIYGRDEAESGSQSPVI